MENYNYFTEILKILFNFENFHIHCIRSLNITKYKNCFPYFPESIENTTITYFFILIEYLTVTHLILELKSIVKNIYKFELLYACNRIMISSPVNERSQ